MQQILEQGLREQCQRDGSYDFACAGELFDICGCDIACDAFCRLFGLRIEESVRFERF